MIAIYASFIFILIFFSFFFFFGRVYKIYINLYVQVFIYILYKDIFGSLFVRVKQLLSFFFLCFNIMVMFSVSQIRSTEARKRETAPAVFTSNLL